ncbi:MAG: N-acetylmuramoyl-L-alanine amidase [Bacteroidales bacterium]|nr:N-acetylmuramoyl-L-alanine amidase [Bacteroidales bacterium]
MNFRRAVLLLASIAMYIAAPAQNAADLRLNTIVLDPGHGGKDPGCISQDKRTQEKDLTLTISKKLAEKIRKQYPEMKVLLTREKDEFVALRDRARFATKNNANLFISIHINAASNRSANGFAAYILGQSSNKNTDTYAFNMDVVTRENSVIYLEEDSTVYGDLNDNSPEAQIMSQFLYNAFREQSLGIAETVNGKMGSPFKHSYGVQQANFQVLREASMPAVLLEMGFISNAGDLALLRSDKSLDQMVDNLFKAFCDYKTSYDASVSISAPAERPAPAPASQAQPAPAANTSDTASQVQEGSVYYGTQVLASSKLMKESDSYFKGYKVRTVKSGNLYKYIVGFSEDLNQAKKENSDIKKVFKDSFMVKVEGNTASML